MDTYEENLLRLNRKIRDLMTHIDTVENKNRKLQQENSVHVEDVASYRVLYATAEQGRLQCKSALEKEVQRNQEQYESYQLLKKRYNDLIKEYVAQNHKLRTHESKDNNKEGRQNRKKASVEIIGNLSDIGKPKLLGDKVTTLERRCATLEKELHKAYGVIDDLEFELESIDHLQDMNIRMERQIRELKSELEQRSGDTAPPTPSTADSLTSPSVHGDSIYSFESIETAECPKQDESKEYQTTPVTTEANDANNQMKFVESEDDDEPYYSNTIFVKQPAKGHQ